MRRPSHERERDHRRDHRERERDSSRDNSWDGNRRQRPPPPPQERADEGREREVQRANPANPNPSGPRGPPPQPPRTGQEVGWRQTPAFGAINRQPGWITQSISEIKTQVIFVASIFCQTDTRVPNSLANF